MNALALDIGGANLKAAHSAGGAWSVPFALWKDPATLPAKLRQVARLAPAFDRLLVTMTAELCDCFASRREGVLHVLASAESLAERRPVRVWLTEGHFADLPAARCVPLRAAASNWQALAMFVAHLYPAGLSLLIDTGSTTTDIIRCRDGRVIAIGFDDTSRLFSGELVYTGARRTPLMALGPTLKIGQLRLPLMAELFATMADVHLLMKDLPDDPACSDTADGRPLTGEFARARIARMIGGSMDSVDVLAALTADDLAAAFAAAQREQLVFSIRKVLSGAQPERIVVSGGGDFVARRAAEAALPGVPGLPDVPVPGVPIIRLADVIGREASVAACAYALLQLEEAQWPAK